jgi:hypothetical protein
MNRTWVNGSYASILSNKSNNNLDSIHSILENSKYFDVTVAKNAKYENIPLSSYHNKACFPIYYTSNSSNRESNKTDVSKYSNEVCVPIYDTTYNFRSRKINEIDTDNYNNTVNNILYESTYDVLNKNNNDNKNIIDERLPDGWSKLYDEKTKKYYYACSITKHTQWLNPSIPIGKMMSNGLPYGWEKEWDEKTKQYYYINHVGRFNTLKPPIKQRSYKGKDYNW